MRMQKPSRRVILTATFTLAVSCTSPTTEPLPAVTQSAKPPFSVADGVIAFSSDLGGNIDVWSIRTDGTGLLRLTGSTGADQSPSWSPNGRRIAFRSDRE